MGKIADAIKAAADKYAKAQKIAPSIERMRKSTETIHRVAQEKRKQ